MTEVGRRHNDYARLIGLSPAMQRGMFAETAARLGTRALNVEKDFWICWTLGALFAQTSKDWPRLVFKGGTSLSKAYDLIQRFSEDIDIAVASEDLGAPDILKRLSTTPPADKPAALASLNAACAAFVSTQAKPALSRELARLLIDAGAKRSHAKVELDPDDEDGLTLLIRYTSVTAEDPEYVSASVRIEFAARSATEPSQQREVRPYLADPSFSFAPATPLTIDSKRTFWDKIIILHGLRHSFDDQINRLKTSGRVSRHYYDVYELLKRRHGQINTTQRKLAVNCRRHSEVFYFDRRLGLETASPGSYRIVPNPRMVKELERDYRRMSVMLFGTPPPFEDILASIKTFEAEVNAAAARQS